MRLPNLIQARPFRGRSGTLVVITILLGCAILAAALEQDELPLSGRARISDGDSFHLDANRVRLLGIDAPELDQTCTDPKGDDWPCGRAARDRLAALISSKSLSCRPDGHDRFGRILATCEAGGRDLGAQMVEAGLAISADDYQREEITARSAKRGLWAGPFDLPRAWRDRHGREEEGNSGWNWLPSF